MSRLHAASLTLWRGGQNVERGVPYILWCEMSLMSLRKNKNLVRKAYWALEVPVCVILIRN